MVEVTMGWDKLFRVSWKLLHQKNSHIIQEQIESCQAVDKIPCIIKYCHHTVFMFMKCSWHSSLPLTNDCAAQYDGEELIGINSLSYPHKSCSVTDQVFFTTDWKMVNSMRKNSTKDVHF